MRVKVFAAMTADKIERLVNSFLDELPHEVIDIKFTAHSGGYGAMVLYRA